MPRSFRGCRGKPQGVLLGPSSTRPPMRGALRALTLTPWTPNFSYFAGRSERLRENGMPAHRLYIGSAT